MWNGAIDTYTSNTCRPSSGKYSLDDTQDDQKKSKRQLTGDCRYRSTSSATRWRRLQSERKKGCEGCKGCRGCVPWWEAGFRFAHHPISPQCPNRPPFSLGRIGKSGATEKEKNVAVGHTRPYARLRRTNLTNMPKTGRQQWEKMKLGCISINQA